MDVRLYLPEEWTKDRARCRAAGVPGDMTFQTRHTQALEMLDESGPLLPHKWATPLSILEPVKLGESCVAEIVRFRMSRANDRILTNSATQMLNGVVARVASPPNAVTDRRVVPQRGDAAGKKYRHPR